MVLTSVIPGLKLKGTFHMDEGFYYFREYEGRVLLGGGRNLDKTGETTTEDGTTLQIQTALEELLRQTILPGRDFSIAQRWSGVMGFRSQGGPPVVEHITPHGGGSWLGWDRCGHRDTGGTTGCRAGGVKGSDD
ncbi:MAG: hypothetical protein IPI95_08240 [Flavobacteriales bacterium]|nr:hypothetical protein [Flavobacteriales bacterium]